MAQQYGCRLVSVRRVGDELVGEFECPDGVEGRPFTTAAFLQGLTSEDGALDPIDPALVLTIRSAGSLAPEAAHAYVQEHVRFQDEEVETFQAPTATLRLGYGDCDDSARALVGLAGAAGVPGRLAFYIQGGTPIHVSAQLWKGGAWHWAETTLPAYFGEDPLDCLTRLGRKRPDIDGQPMILDTGAMGSLRGLVEAQRTTVTPQALANAIAAVYPSVFGGSPGPYAVQVLVAQSAYETKAWKLCWNNNLGNVKWTGTGDYFTLQNVREGQGSSTTYSAQNFRNYGTLAEGIKDWLKVLALPRYSAAMAAAKAGDVADFVQGLANGGYFTGNEQSYASGVAMYYAQYANVAPSEAWGDVEWATGWQVTEPVAVGAALASILLGALAARFLP